MVGWLAIGGEDWRVRLEQVQVRGLPLLRARVPDPPGLRRRGLERRIDRASRLLARSGCRRVLTPAGFAGWERLTRWGLIPVAAEGLAQALAARIALAQLKRRGIRPAWATVGLYAHRVNRACFEAARVLCPCVRQLVVDAPDGGEDLARYLREEFGAAVLEGRGGRRPDVCLCFTPGEEVPQGGLVLWGTRPDLGGLVPVPGGTELPGQVDPMALTALLWEEGRVALEEVVLTGGENLSPGNAP